MSLPPSIFNNEDGGIDNPFDDGENTPMWAMVPKPERQVGVNLVDSGLTIKFNLTTLGSSNADSATPEAKNRVIMTTDDPHVISWAPVNTSVVVQKAVWQGFDENKWQTMKEANITTKQTSIGPGNPEMTLLATQAALPVPLVDSPSPLAKWNTKNMYLLLYWTVNGKSGSTRSGLFTVFSGEFNGPEYNALVARYNGEKQASDKTMNGEDNPSDLPSEFNSGATSTLPAATASPTPTHDLGAGAGTGDNGDSIGVGSGGGGGGGGLPAGAIAGIVVGVVLGVALVAFLLWFFLLRRRRRADHVAGHGPGNGPHDYLADKETQARVTESPHSPYTDDGQPPLPPQPQQQQQFHLAHQDDHEAVLPAAASSPTGRRSFAPYNEQEHTPVASRSVDNLGRDGARSSTPNVNSNVSHLIEDGMTEDEIRRLEEEERALDAAIEQAGQGGGQGQRR